MDPREWLAARRPAPPVTLAASLEVAVSGFVSSPDVSMSATLSEAGAGILERLTGATAPASRREVAIELLSADALLTYALEAAAEDCESFAASADAVIARLVSLASAGNT
jgi:hypothetical protein